MGRIERVDNRVGRSLFLRYSSDRIVAVDYQIQRAKGYEPYVWVTEQNVVSYAYGEPGRAGSSITTFIRRKTDRGELARAGPQSGPNPDDAFLPVDRRSLI